ncbi:hypothetical protein ACH42_08670 [Endozoicomonas sp. (ex Bugula neritina AB1)]|nr:hypothetical protein ACH42_08670 [Endozoicomonas sp. (ex Bugula neritina AB1)]
MLTGAHYIVRIYKLIKATFIIFRNLPLVFQNTGILLLLLRLIDIHQETKGAVLLLLRGRIRKGWNKPPFKRFEREKN